MGNVARIVWEMGDSDREYVDSIMWASQPVATTTGTPADIMGWKRHATDTDSGENMILLKKSRGDVLKPSEHGQRTH